MVDEIKMTFFKSSFFFVLAEGFVQLVAPRQTYQRVVSVVHRFAITMQRADAAK